MTILTFIGGTQLCSRASNEGYPTKVLKYFTITEKAPTRALSWLKVPTSASTFKKLSRHYAKIALTSLLRGCENLDEGLFTALV